MLTARIATHFAPRWTAVLALSALAPPALARERLTQVELDGAKVDVEFSDADTFEVASGTFDGTKARLEGFNALESYGPVHRWGKWTAKELSAITDAASEHARKGGWRCASKGPKDRYGRILVYCADLAESLVAAGLAHVFYVEGTPPASLLEAQRKAIANELGMWRKGVPKEIVTSLHSASEKGEIYNRVTSVTDGMARERPHKETYEVCQEVCAGDSCMVHVPFDLRYGNRRARCLR